MDYAEKNNWYTHCLYNRRVDGIVAISCTIATLLVQAGVDAKKVRLIPSGIDPHAFEHAADIRQSSNGECIVGTMAVLEERKGLAFLLDAAAILKAEGLRVKYSIAGDGSLRSQLENEVIRLGLQDAIRFFGFVSDPASFLADIDIFVMPSLYEGLGVAALEAMAAGKAVVAARVGGLVESVIDSVTGLLVPARDPVALAHAIGKLVRNPALARQMGQKGAARVRQHFTMEQMARGNECYYYELLAAADSFAR
jgi:glycosyltransferase involved in cell wall biosynthesis